MKKHSIFWGIILLGGGVLLLLNALGFGAEFAVVPMLASLLLLAISIVSLANLNFVMGLLPLSVITYLWRDQLGLQDMKLWVILLSALLLGIGLSIIFWKSKKKKIGSCFHHNDHEEDWPSAESITSTDDSENVTVDSSFGDHVKYVRSANLKKVKIDSNFSSVKVYFDQCQVSPEGASIYVDCNFSGVFLYIPRTWSINNQTHVFAGSVEGATIAAGDYTQVNLIGDVNFGSVKIIYM